MAIHLKNTQKELVAKTLGVFAHAPAGFGPRTITPTTMIMGKTWIFFMGRDSVTFGRVHIELFLRILPLFSFIFTDGRLV